MSIQHNYQSASIRSQIRQNTIKTQKKKKRNSKQAKQENKCWNSSRNKVLGQKTPKLNNVGTFFTDCRELVQNLCSWSACFPKDIDSFAHKVNSWNAFRSRGVLQVTVNRGEFSNLPGRTRITVISKADGQHFKPGYKKLMMMMMIIWLLTL